MTVELLQTLSIAAYIASGILLLVAVALFFLLDIPKIYGDVSGRTAKRAIEAIRQQNESTGNKAYKPSAVNAERGRLTDKISSSGRLQSKTEGLPVSVGTEKFSTSALAPQTNETTILEQQLGETTVLTSALPPAAGETTLLMEEAAAEAANQKFTEFTVVVEMSFLGSTEIIE